MSESLGWLVQLTCCGRDNGTYGTRTWQEADDFREIYLSAPGHDRSAIIVTGSDDLTSGMVWA
jgi:hypothetical protein